MQNAELIERAILRAEQLLTNSAWPHEQIVALHGKLDSMRDRIANMRCQEGLAIFISPNLFKVTVLPFPVKEKIIPREKF